MRTIPSAQTRRIDSRISSGFRGLVATLDDVPEHVQESTFINGLKPEMRVEV